MYLLRISEALKCTNVIKFDYFCSVAKKSRNGKQMEDNMLTIHIGYLTWAETNTFYEIKIVLPSKTCKSVKTFSISKNFVLLSLKVN